MENSISKDNQLLLKVSVDFFYYIPDSINGWDEETIIADWFKNTPIHNSHATRDSYRIGNITKIRKIDVLKRGKFNFTKIDLE